jgi:hypothetical protein
MSHVQNVTRRNRLYCHRHMSPGDLSRAAFAVTNCIIHRSHLLEEVWNVTYDEDFDV